MVRFTAALSSALIGLGLVSAVAYARRAPELPPVIDTSIEEDGDDDRLSPAWGPTMELASAERGTPFLKLRLLHVVNVNTRRSVDCRLYDSFGRIDEDAATGLDDLLADARDSDNVRTKVLHRRVLQLLFRAAYHFGSKTVQVISGYREPGTRSEGRHGLARAVDFRLTNVSAAALASYLRKVPQVGVGVYTNPSTQFVHLDDRDRSYHWLDASPPGRHWRERALWGVGMAKRDASYTRHADWPEGTEPSPMALAVERGPAEPDPH